MSGTITLLIILLATLSTAFLSSIFGMLGGLILMGALITIMPVSQAMVLHGLIQLTSNGYRAWLNKTDIKWNIVSTLNYLSLEKEMEIILGKNKNLNNPKGKEQVSNMIKVASLTRKGFMAGDISTVMSPRTVLHWAENSEIFKDIGYAFRVTFLNKCDDAEKNTIAEYYQRCFGEELPESMINIQV